MHNKLYRIGAFWRSPAESQELDVEMVKETEAIWHNEEKAIVIIRNASRGKL